MLKIVCFALAATAAAVIAALKSDHLAARSVTPTEASLEVLLCDGETRVSVSPSGPMTAEDGRRVAAGLMAQWIEKNPQAEWDQDERVAHTVNPPADNRHLLGKGQGAENTYRSISELDVVTWQNENLAFAREGARIFHSGAELGTTIAVSCDMCHPDASNTHPETYPKFQTQLGKVVLLRDMINWCLEHPVRAKKLDADDPKMRAMEAYIYAQRKGKVLDYGKH